MTYALYLFFGSCPHSPVCNTDASSHAVSESQCGSLGLVMIEYCRHPQPGTKERSDHWYLKEDGCVETDIPQVLC